MTKKTFISIISASLFLSCYSQTKVFFPNLTRLSIDTSFKVFFNYDKKNSQIINIDCHKLPNSDPYFCPPEVEVTAFKVAAYKNPNLTDSIFITYNSGMSDDPTFSIWTRSGKKVAYFAAIEFYINSSGTIYTSGHTNNMFDRKRKFQLQNDSIIEIKQPYYYVGLKGKLLKGITLYSDKVGNNVVAQLPKDHEIEVLLAESSTQDFSLDLIFLVKTDFGLVGWVRLTNEDIYGAVLKDLYYAGD